MQMYRVVPHTKRGIRRPDLNPTYVYPAFIIRLGFAETLNLSK